MQCKKSVFNESEISEDLFVTIYLNGLHLSTGDLKLMVPHYAIRSIDF